MKTTRIVLMSLFVAGALGLSACESDVDVKEVGDKDTVSGSVGQEVSDETIEKSVEVKLTAEPGFGDVDVESKPDGIIVLNGTAATDAEKMKAEEIAKATDGVKGVENNITVAAPH